MYYIYLHILNTYYSIVYIHLRYKKLDETNTTHEIRAVTTHTRANGMRRNPHHHPLDVVHPVRGLRERATLLRALCYEFAVRTRKIHQSNAGDPDERTRFWAHLLQHLLFRA